MKSKPMRVSSEFKEFIDNIRREFRIKNDTEATRFLAKRRVRLLKGSILDFFPMVLILFIFGVCSIIGYFLITQVETEFAAEPMIPNQTMDILAISKSTISYLDDVFIFLIFGLAIAIVIGGYRLKTSPIYIGIGIFVLVFVLIVTGVISNAFIVFTEESTLSVSVSQFGKTVLAWQHMPVIILVIAVMVFVVMYSRPNKESGGGGFA